MVAVGIALGLLCCFPTSAVAQDGPCIELSREIVEPVFALGGELTIQITIDSTCTTAIGALGLQEILPTGWSYVEDSLTGDNLPNILRFDDDADRIDFGWFNFSGEPIIVDVTTYVNADFPVTFTYKVSVPSTKAMTLPISGQALYRLDDILDAEEHRSDEVVTQISDADLVGPVITLVGSDEVVECNDTYSDAGATAEDNIDGDVTANIVVGGTVDTTTPGIYDITYDVQDVALNPATQVVRVVEVVDTVAPVITLLGDPEVTTYVGGTYVDDGATAADSCDAAVNVTVDTSAVNMSEAGDYTVTLSAVDASGNAAASLTRTVHVVLDDEAPVITLLGDTVVNTDCSTGYVEPGVEALDNGGAIDLSNDVVIVGLVPANRPGTYTITYSLTDAAGNEAQSVERTVIVADVGCTLPALCELAGVAMIEPSGDRMVPAISDIWTTVNGDVVLRAQVLFSGGTGCEEGDVEVTYVLNGATETPLTSTDASTNYEIPVNLALGENIIDVYATLLDTGAEVQSFLEFNFGTAEDSDGDGYPDDPFGALDEDGDRWAATVSRSMSGENADKSVHMVRFDACGANAEDVIVVLPNPEDMNQTLTVSVPRAVIGCGEAGILMVTLADDLDSLMGASEADKLGNASGELTAGATYFEVSIILGDDGDIVEISDSMLASNGPLTISLDGLNINAELPAALKAHPTNVVSDGSTGLLLQGVNGQWNANGIRDIPDGTSNTLILSEVTKLSVFSVYDAAPKSPAGCAVDSSGKTDVGFGDFMLVFAVLAALFGISQFRASRARD
jgi:hypothetical protein